jgi:hypothetical protein
MRAFRVWSLTHGELGLAKGEGRGYNPIHSRPRIFFSLFSPPLPCRKRRTGDLLSFVHPTGRKRR